MVYWISIRKFNEIYSIFHSKLYFIYLMSIIMRYIHPHSPTLQLQSITIIFLIFIFKCQNMNRSLFNSIVLLSTKKNMQCSQSENIFFHSSNAHYIFGRVHTAHVFSDLFNRRSHHNWTTLVLFLFYSSFFFIVFLHIFL